MKHRYILVSLMILALGTVASACGAGTTALVNLPPGLPTINCPVEAVSAGETINLGAFTVDPDGDELSYLWATSMGLFSNPESHSTTWTAPASEGNYVIAVVVSDGTKQASSECGIQVQPSGIISKGLTFRAEPPSESFIRAREQTRVTPPESKLFVREVAKEDWLQPPGVKVIATLDITPNGLTFAPPFALHFRLPLDHKYKPGDVLNVLQYDEQMTEWLSVGEATVDNNGYFAIGEISHTSLFALVDRTPASPEPTATPPPCVVTPPVAWTAHVVRPGDTLFSLARFTGTTMARVQQVNCLPDETIKVGQLLWLAAPIPACSPQQPDGWAPYIVQLGDTLFSLGRRSGTTVTKIRQVNCLYGTLKAGTMIWLPHIVIPPSPTPTLPLPTEPSPTWTSTPPPTYPDLIIENIDIDALSVTCTGSATIPGQEQSCLTRVNFTIANIGKGSAGTFSILTALGPSQSVTAVQQAAGLNPGETQIRTATISSSTHCYDMYGATVFACSVCITIDNYLQVTESKEENNMRCEADSPPSVPLLPDANCD